MMNKIFDARLRKMVKAMQIEARCRLNLPIKPLS